MIDYETVRLRRLSYALGTSIAAIAAAAASPASAQCAPDPTVTSGTTDCLGTDEDGLFVGTSGTRVNVAADAVVRAGSGSGLGAITIASMNNNLTVNGRVDGGTKAGVALFARPRTTVPCDPYAGASVEYCLPGSTTQSDPWVSATVVVAEGATVTGAQALLLTKDASNTSGSIYLGIGNSGIMTATGGPAIVSLVNGGSLSISNEVTGRIDGAMGRIDAVRNDGVIDGGAGSALGITIGTNASYANVTNRGQIVSSGSAPTVSSTGTLYVENATGAVLGGGAVAIDTAGALVLNNQGKITGSVVSRAPAGRNSHIDTRQGTIAGDVLLGAGDDSVLARFDTATAQVSSITGALDGGAGVDTLTIGVDQDTTLAGAALPKNFERLGLDLSQSTTVTLAPTFTTASGVAVGGVGSLVNQADLTTSGAAVTGASYSVSFVNEANITATLPAPGNGQGAPASAAVSGIGSVQNAGTITALGGAGVQAMASFANSGTISASGTAASVSNGAFENSGVIVSTGGIGAAVQRNYGDNLTNSGSIGGATTGLALSNGRLENSGTISGGVTGVSLTNQASLINAAEGTITGQSSAITSNGWNVGVVNAGTINGNVTLALQNYDTSGDIFVDDGGVVNGTILLGGGDDELVVDFGATAGNRPLGGATGGVDAGNGYDTLRYRVNADAAAGPAAIGGFEALAYELDNNAALTLRTSEPTATAIGLTGNGRVTLEGSLSVTDRTLVDAGIQTVGQRLYGAAGVDQGLTIVNNGTLSLTKQEPNDYTRRWAINAAGSTVINNGSIVVTGVAGSYYPAAALFNADDVTNTGTITVTGGGRAIENADIVVNSGTIIGTGTGQISTAGIGLISSLTNSGTIRFEGNAVQIGYTSSGTPLALTNSGTIESMTSTAVTLDAGAMLINEADGVLRGAKAIEMGGGGVVINRGVIVGDVGSQYYSWGGGIYVADGGTLEGDLLFGSANDVFIMTGTETGVTGMIDGGEGSNAFGYALRGSGSVSLTPHAQLVNFDSAVALALGVDTVATIAGAEPFAGALQVGGNGKVVNTASISGRVTISPSSQLGVGLLESDQILATFENQGTLSGGVSGTVATFVNSGTISATAPGQDYYFPGVLLRGQDSLAFTNSGEILGPAALYGSVLTVANAGNITGGEAASVALRLVMSPSIWDAPVSATIVNSGTISGAPVALQGSLPPPLYYSIPPGTPDEAASTVAASVAITNTQTGVIRGGDVAVVIYDAALTLDNAGTINVPSFDPGTGDGLRGYAVASLGDFADTVRNTGTLDGLVWLDGGDDRVENAGTISRDILLGLGDDVFVQYAGAVLGGIVDGGEGADRFVMAGTGDGALDAGRITGFEALNQVGTATVRYSGGFKLDTIALDGGTLAVAAGQTLATAGGVTVTGGNAGVSLLNAGTIAGSVLLGAGNDSYLEGAGSLAAGGVGGGEGVDLYRVALAGDRTGIGARTGFELLSVEGAGTLALTLDQDFQSVSMAGTNLVAALSGFTIGRIDGSDMAEQVALDGDVAAASLGGGNDVLALGNSMLAGRYDGGLGADALRFTAAGPVVLTGTASGFETLELTGGALVVAGALGSTGAELSFVGSGAQALTVANGGTLAGVINLGAGDDAFRLAAGGTLAGNVAGGAGTDTAILELSSDFTLVSGRIAGFERLVTEGTGALTLAGGGFAFDTATAGGHVTVAADAALSSGLLSFGASNDRLTIAGEFAGSVAGGGGNDNIEVSGRATFAAISAVEELRMSAGYATISGNAVLGEILLNGGRLTGLAGSTISAPSITVAQGATFGSAGTVNGNVAVAGTLSPGASPGTMTVNGDVALAGTSVSVFEITPTMSDKLVVNGDLAIAKGATLQIVADQAVLPGQSLDIITVNGNVAGSFTTVLKPESLFGFVVQREGTISLLGQFLSDAAYSGQVRGAVDYVNGLLVSGGATDAFLAAVPNLVNANGAADEAAFARLTPDAYASATQIAVEQGLELANVGRSGALVSHRGTPGAFTFASALGSTRTLEVEGGGTGQARTNGYGFLGGLGWSGEGWSAGGFVGYFDSRQTLERLGARTDTDGIVAGVHARWSAVAGGRGFGVKATVAYSGGQATTSRALPEGAGGAGGSASADFDLEGWTGDISVDYAVPLSRNWSVRPAVGVTAVRTTRAGTAETGGSPYALAVARERDKAVFVDGALTFQGGVLEGATFRPYLSLGARYQFEGRNSGAVAALGGGGFGLRSAGARRAPWLATATVGADVALSSRLRLFGALSGEAGHSDNRASARTGLHLAF